MVAKEEKEKAACLGDPDRQQVRQHQCWIVELSGTCG